MNKQLFTKWYVKYVLLALCGIILLIIPFLKTGQVGTEPFLIERLSQDISLYDGHSFSGRFAAYSWGTPLLFNVVPDILLNFLPFILGILTFVLFALILKDLTKDIDVFYISLLLLTLSPSFIYLFSFSNFSFVPVFLALAAFFLFTKEKLQWLTIPILLILPLFSIVITSSLLLVLFCYAFFWKKDKKILFMILLFLALLVGSLYYGFILYNTGTPAKVILEKTNPFGFFQNVIFELGSNFGIGLFLIILAIAGAISYWSEKYNNLFLFFSTAFLLGFAMIRQEALLLLNFVLVYLAALGMNGLFKQKWASKRFKQFVLFILILGVVFSGSSQLIRINDSQPGPEIIKGLEFLEQQEKGVVFSHYSRGVWINSVGHRNVADENSLFVENLDQRFEDVNALFYSRELENSMALINKYRIDYIWIDEGFKDEIWSYDTEGMLFILQYTKDFNKIYDEEGVEIWKIKR